ncbi:MAG: aquaporin [Anaerolineae bacterium]|jgi:MIP family channel proteins|nr:aquaporin [Anaerolineae bacterium]
MDPKMFKPTLAEFLGTFTLIFVGACAVVLAGQFGVLVPAFAHGFAVIGGAFMFGAISGGHFNPAVTFAMLITQNINLFKALYYWVAQFAGAILAALMVGTLTGGYGETIGSISPTGEFVKVAVFEAILTFFLVSAIFQTAVHGRAGNLAPIAIGLTLTMCILAGGPFTGASLNPARTLGPALAAGNIAYVIPYFVGPALGAAFAALLHSRFLKD